MQDETPRRLTINNEFASVHVFTDPTNDSLLRIENARTGESVTVDPLELEAMTRLTHEELAMLANPSFPGIDGLRPVVDDALIPGEGEIPHPGVGG